MKNFWSKVLIFFLIIVILANGLFLPRKAKAQLPVIDFANLARMAWEWVQTTIENALLDFVRKQIMDMIVRDTITWIQGGGTPKFITDWRGFLQDAANVAFDTVINQVGLARLCQPFSMQIQLSLLPVQRFPTRISCTLDQIVGNINNFYNNFSNGGWIAYSASWDPNNNWYGNMLQIEDQFIIENSRRVRAAQNEGQASAGFLGVRRCLNGFNNVDGTFVCTQEEIVTPGEAVGQSVASAITSDSRWDQDIKSWTSALINALINRIIREGLGLLRNAIGP